MVMRFRGWIASVVVTFMMVALAPSGALATSPGPTYDVAAPTYYPSVSLSSSHAVALVSLGSPSTGAQDASWVNGVASRGCCVAANTVAKTCSFTGPTLVLMADGTNKPIADVKVGDQVIATDPETGEQAVKSVTHVWVHEDTVTDLVVDGEVIATTEDHPFWSASDQRFERADELSPGEKILGADGRIITVSGLEFGTGREALAYNLSVEGIHTYHVGDGAILVHNECSIVGRRIAERSLEEGHKIPGLDTPELLGRYVDDITSIPGTPATRGRTAWWDNDRGLIIIRQGDSGTVFKPDRGYRYFRDQILE